MEADDLPVDPRLVVVVLVPLAVVSGFFLVNYQTVTTGEEVHLEVVEPLDPRDVFRGQYATLTYEVSTLDISRLTGDDGFQEGDTVYVELERRGRYHDPVSLHRNPPDGVLCMEGEVTSAGGSSLSVEYGVEEFFADPDTAEEVGEARWRGNVSAVVVVDDGCDAVLRAVNVDGEEIRAR